MVRGMVHLRHPAKRDFGLGTRYVRLRAYILAEALAGADGTDLATILATAGILNGVASAAVGGHGGPLASQSASAHGVTTTLTSSSPQLVRVAWVTPLSPAFICQTKPSAKTVLVSRLGQGGGVGLRVRVIPARCSCRGCGD